MTPPDRAIWRVCAAVACAFAVWAGGQLLGPGERVEFVPVEQGQEEGP